VAELADATDLKSVSH